MENGANILIIVYFNGSIIRTAKKSVVFINDEPVCLRISQNYVICRT